jgi:AcrR family transcriptional regulator
MVAATSPGLRERTRQLVAREITETAEALFIERGYEATTIDDIAAAVGMSRRSVFRYFPTKEDLVLGKLDFLADELIRAFRARPDGEDVWDSLRAVFELLVPIVDTLDKDSVAAPMQRVIFSTPSLLSAYLGMQQRMQDVIVAGIRERSAARGASYAPGDPAPHAVTAAAFGCLVAAQKAWLEEGNRRSFADTLDQAMAVITPVLLPRPPG